MATLRGENKIVLNHATMHEILQDWFNSRAPNDPDVDVTSVYLENTSSGNFVVVTREREQANG